MSTGHTLLRILSPHHRWHIFNADAIILTIDSVYFARFRRKTLSYIPKVEYQTVPKFVRFTLRMMSRLKRD